jgi:FkbH-like protein
MRPVRFFFARNLTIEPFGEALSIAGKEVGVEISCEFGSYGNALADIFEAGSRVSPPEFVCVVLSLDYLGAGIFSPSWRIEDAEREVDQFLAALDGLPPGVSGIVATFVPGPRCELPASTETGDAALILNARIRSFVAARAGRIGLLELDRIVASLSLGACIDRRFGLMMKAPFTAALTGAATKELVRQVRVRQATPYKVLVLDCDNTLWGGVVGEAGVEGIALDPYEYPGIAFYRFQSEILRMAEKGVLLCLCSKNDEDAVFEVLDNHPHCLIRRKNLAGWKVNWTDKAANIRDLAAELNLGIDSMVFVDDNPVECELTAKALPELRVVLLPKKVYQIPEFLGDLNLFDRVSVSREDRERAGYYQAEQSRREVQKKVTDPASFLEALEMRAVVRRAQEADISRAAQLCQRTNQFNLTTKRYTEADMAGFLANQDCMVFLLEAADKFGPMGTSGLIIVRRHGGEVDIDTFLVSCRIIGRKFDQALFRVAVREAVEAWAASLVTATFAPTAKNSLVKSLYNEYGFEGLEAPEGTTFRSPSAKLDLAPPKEIALVESL